MTCLWPVSVCAAPLGVVVGRWRTRLLGRRRKTSATELPRDATFGRPKRLHGLASTGRGKRHGYRRRGTSREELAPFRGEARRLRLGESGAHMKASFGHRSRGNSAPEGRGEPTYSASASVGFGPGGLETRQTGHGARSFVGHADGLRGREASGLCLGSLYSEQSLGGQEKLAALRATWPGTASRSNPMSRSVTGQDTTETFR